MPIKTRAPRQGAKSRTSPGQVVIPGMGALEPNKKKREEPELLEQTTLFYYLRLYADRHPALGFVHASMNGLPLTPAVVRKAIASGLTAGVWDVLVPACRRHPATGEILVAGMWLEMKWGRNGLTPEQERFGAWAASQGYARRTAYNWIDGLFWITRYLNVSDPHIDRALHINRKAGVAYATPDPLAPIAPLPGD